MSAPEPRAPDRFPVRQSQAPQLFSRLTAVLGIALLIAALFAWILRPGHYRLVLLILVLAMFLSILHNYSLEDNGNGNER